MMIISRRRGGPEHRAQDRHSEIDRGPISGAEWDIIRKAMSGAGSRLSELSGASGYGMRAIVAHRTEGWLEMGRQRSSEVPQVMPEPRAANRTVAPSVSRPAIRAESRVMGTDAAPVLP